MGPQGPVGETGAQGPKGNDGEQGPKGEVGPEGAPGQVGATGERGPKGEQGLPGAGGKSAYELFLAENPNSDLSLGQWMQSLKGDKGDTGEPGANGHDGAPGQQGVKGDKGDSGTAHINGVNAGSTASKNATLTKTVLCGPGQVATGGGASTDNQDNYLYMNAPVFDANSKAIGWQGGSAKSSGQGNYTLSVYVLCAPAA